MRRFICTVVKPYYEKLESGYFKDSDSLMLETLYSWGLLISERARKHTCESPFFIKKPNKIVKVGSNTISLRQTKKILSSQTNGPKAGNQNISIKSNKYFSISREDCIIKSRGLPVEHLELESLLHQDIWNRSTNNKWKLNVTVS